MSGIDRLLEYVRRTNPEMTKNELLYRLQERDYTAKCLFMIEENSGKTK